MGIPILVPTIEFVQRLKTFDDNKVLKSCVSHDADADHLRAGPPGHVPPSENEKVTPQAPPRHPKSTVTIDPESNEAADEASWIGRTPYYRWPHVIQFSSWENLMLLLNTTNWKTVHEAMIQDNHQRFTASRFFMHEIFFVILCD